MLTYLFVSNYALIDELSLDFDRGLTIITGETGAGKSILLGALKLVLGERADLKSVKNPEQKCVVEAHFDLSKLNIEAFFTENDIDFELITILRREILPSGKSRAFINDVPVVLNKLNELSTVLIDIHSQFETAELLKDSFQFAWIDAVAGQQSKVAEFSAELQNFNSKRKRLDELEKQRVQNQKDLDYNTFLFEELTAASLDGLSVENLENEQFRLENAEEIAANLSETIQLFENEEFGILNALNMVLTKSKAFPEDLKERLEAIRIESKDLNDELNATLDSTEINQERLIEVQQRLNTVNQLLSKHQVQQVEELISVREELNQKLLSGVEADSEASKLKKDIERTEKALDAKAKIISEGREKVIPLIEEEVAASMKKLGMPNSVLDFNLSEAGQFNAFGKNEIDLKFSANLGMVPKSIDKAVSGGERSRLMLAVKESVAKHQELPTLILDEIDTGVSGKIAESMGEIMAEAAANLQIIAITHLPQVAAFGNHHFKVMKYEKDNTVTTQVIPLDTDEKINEIAQMLSGKNVSTAAIAQAKQLLKIK